MGWTVSWLAGWLVGWDGWLGMLITGVWTADGTKEEKREKENKMHY